MGESITITYETLFDLLRREKNREELQSLEPMFFKEVAEYIKAKEEAMRSQDAFSLEAKKITLEVTNIRKIITELYERRERKIFNLALYKARTNSKIIDTTFMLEEEKFMYEVLAELFAKFREQILEKVLQAQQPLVSAQPVPFPSPTRTEVFVKEETSYRDMAPEKASEEVPPLQQPVAAPAQEAMKTIRFLHPVPRFLGKELEVYGPFDEEEIVRLPGDIADVIIAKGRAEEMKV